MKYSVLEAIGHYSLGYDDRITEREAEFSRYILSNGSAAGKIKEHIVCWAMGYKTELSEHGYDFYHRRRPGEIKSESAKCGGFSSWSHLTIKKLKQYKGDNPKFVQSGFTKEGRCIYIASMDFNDTNLYDELYKQVKSGITGCKASSIHWGDVSREKKTLVVEHLSDIASDVERLSPRLKKRFGW